MPGVLYTYPNNFRAQKIQIAAKYSGFDLTLGEFVAGETEKSSEFLKNFPLGKVPAFEGDGLFLFESNAIANYVGNDTLRGGEREAEVLQWIGIAENDLLPAACNWVYPTLGIMQYNKQATEKAKNEIKCILNLLNNYLLNHTFLVGERITQADISMACTFVMLYTNVLDASFRAPYSNVNRWFVTLVNQVEFKSIIGEVVLCSKMGQFDSKKYNEISGKEDKKEKAAKKPPQTKKPKEKAAGDIPTEEDKPIAPPAKLDPWRNAPKPSMDMDAWKRCYSNNPKNVSWDYFLKNFKKEDYSIWRGKYLYDDEFRMGFMAGNLINGMFQRLEKLRKHAFGVGLVFAKGSKFQIDTMWFWLGHELAFPLCPDWTIDYESFEWTKMDIDDETTKALVKDFWALDGDFDGREIDDYNVYK